MRSSSVLLGLVMLATAGPSLAAPVSYPTSTSFARSTVASGALVPSTTPTTDATSEALSLKTIFNVVGAGLPIVEGIFHHLTGGYVRIILQHIYH